jgi:hypothetical protein
MQYAKLREECLNAAGSWAYPIPTERFRRYVLSGSEKLEARLAFCRGRRMRLRDSLQVDRGEGDAFSAAVAYPPASTSAAHECHTKTDRRTEKYNKINIKQDCDRSSILSGSTISSLKPIT